MWTKEFAKNTMKTVFWEVFPIPAIPNNLIAMQILKNPVSISTKEYSSSLPSSKKLGIQDFHFRSNRIFVAPSSPTIEPIDIKNNVFFFSHFFHQNWGITKSHISILQTYLVYECIHKTLQFRVEIVCFAPPPQIIFRNNRLSILSINLQIR